MTIPTQLDLIETLVKEKLYIKALDLCVMTEIEVFNILNHIVFIT